MDGVTYNNKSILEKYDSTPTTNSSNLVNSGVVKQYVDYEVADIRSDVDDMIDRVGNPFVFKGTKATISALPSSGNTINDCWFVEETGFIYCWDGTAWSKASTDVNNQLAHCIAEEYSDQKVYKQGELVIYNNAVYVRKSDATAQEGTFVSANWTQTNIGNQLYEEVTNLKNALSGVENLNGYDLLKNGQWHSGGIGSSGANSSPTNRIRFPNAISDDLPKVNEYRNIYFDVALGYQYSCYFYDETKTWFSKSTGNTVSKNIEVPNNAVYARFVLYWNPDVSGTMNISEGKNLSVYGIFKIQEEIDKINKDILDIKNNSGKKKTIKAAELRQGVLNSTNGKFSPTNMNRVSSSSAIQIKDNLTLYIAQWLNCTIYWYSDAGWNGFLSVSGVVSGTFAFSDLTIPDGAMYFRLNLSRYENPSTALSPLDIGIDDLYFIEKDEFIIAPEVEEITEANAVVLSLSQRTILFCKDGNVYPSYIPPDSYYAIKETAKAEYDGIRFSVYKTTDNNFVAVHNVTINGLAVNTDGTEISETINTGDCSLAELNQYDWGLKYDEKYRGLTVPLLDDCLGYAAMYSLDVAIDLKNPSTYSSSDIEALANMLINHGCDNAIIIRANSSEQSYLISRSPRFSIEHIGDLDSLNSNMTRLKSLMTGYNHIYWANTESRTQNAVNIAYENGFELSGSADSVSNLVSDISRGARYEEIEKINNVKRNIRLYVDSLFD